jgi:hypothetical protein
MVDAHGYLTPSSREAIVGRRGGDDHGMRIHVFERSSERNHAVKGI